MMGGRNAPREGWPKITIESFCRSCADAGVAIIAAESNKQRPIPNGFTTSSSYSPFLYKITLRFRLPAPRIPCEGPRRSARSNALRHCLGYDADHLALDLVGIHPFEPCSDVQKRLSDGSGRLVAGKSKADA